MQKQSNAMKQVTWFFVLTLGLSFMVFWGPLALFQVTTISFVSDAQGPIWAILLFILGGFVPSAVALVLTWRWEGWAGLKHLWQRMISVKIGWRWYLAAVALIAFGTVSQIILLRLLGQTFDLSLFVVQLPSALPLIVLGPLSEELGWRGFAQDRLQLRLNPLIAAVIVGVCWAFWHLPLFLMPGTSQHELGIPFISFACGITSQSVLFAWLYNHTGGSVWTAIFFHWIYTYAGQVIASGVTRSPLYNWLEYTPYLLAALLVVLIWWREPPNGQAVKRVISLSSEKR